MKESSNRKKKIKVLLIEDDKDILETVRITLERNGFIVRPLSHGRDALSTAIKIKPHVIVTDIMMPAPDGFEICRTLRACDETKNIPIIFLSARTQPLDVDTGFKAGADRYLTKPFQNEDLLNAIKGLAK